jgi:hypothetical protein
MFGFGTGLVNDIFGMILMTDDLDSVGEEKRQALLVLKEELQAGRITEEQALELLNDICCG